MIIFKTRYWFIDREGKDDFTGQAVLFLNI